MPLTILFILIIFIVFLISLVVYARWNYGKLNGLGFPVVKPSIILGSDPQGYKNVQHIEDYNRFKQYGDIYGFFEGRSPQVHVCDPEMLRLILTKDYEYFNERLPTDFGNPITNSILGWQKPDEKWKFLRSAITPNFTSQRVREFSECVKELVQAKISDLKIKHDSRFKMEFRELVTSVYAKAIEKCFCGVTLESSSNSFEILMKEMLSEFKEYNIKHELVRAFPFLIRFHPTIPKEQLSKFEQLILNLISSRRSTPTTSRPKATNFIDSLIDLLEKAKEPKYQQLNVTEINAVALSLEVFLATFDSVSSSVVVLAYYLATNPHVQERLMEEIDGESLEKDADEAFRNMPYLHATLQEAFRMAPAFFRLERKCVKSWSYKGYKIPAGMKIVIPVWPVNYHPKYYEDPEMFRPERFLQNSGTSAAFLSFGAGPKNCIGQKLAYDMGKVLIANFLKSFNFEERSDTELRWKAGSSFILKFHPMVLDIVKRSN